MGRKKIKKPWCTYGGGLGLWGYGKIVEESENSVHIRYSEGQLYSPECWDKNPRYVQRYDTLEEAAYKYKDYFNNYTDLRMDHPYSNEEFNMLMKHNFPSYFRQKNRRAKK